MGVSPKPFFLFNSILIRIDFGAFGRGGRMGMVLFERNPK